MQTNLSKGFAARIRLVFVCCNCVICVYVFCSTATTNVTSRTQTHTCVCGVCVCLCVCVFAVVLFFTCYARYDKLLEPPQSFLWQSVPKISPVGRGRLLRSVACILYKSFVQILAAAFSSFQQPGLYVYKCVFAAGVPPYTGVRASFSLLGPGLDLSKYITLFIVTHVTAASSYAGSRPRSVFWGGGRIRNFGQRWPRQWPKMPHFTSDWGNPSSISPRNTMRVQTQRLVAASNYVDCREVYFFVMNNSSPLKARVTEKAKCRISLQILISLEKYLLTKQKWGNWRERERKRLPYSV